MLLSHDPAHAFVPYPSHNVAMSPSGPLRGLSFAVKDLFDVEGYPTGSGQPHYLARSGIKTRNAPAVQQLLDAGAFCVGKTVTDELAFSLVGKNAHFGAPLNGATPERISGGSSSGSASAVSFGLCDFALGTDTAGSIRAPASHCGLFGLRPTHGLVSLSCATPLAPSFDTCGWLTRDLQTMESVSAVMLELEVEQGCAKPELLLPSDAWSLVEEGPRSKQLEFLQQMPALQTAGDAALALESFDVMASAFRHIQSHEAWVQHGDFIRRYQPELGPGVKERFDWASRLNSDAVLQASQFRERYASYLQQLLGDERILVLPTVANIAPLCDATESELDLYRQQSIRLLCAASLAGLPQLTLPLTFYGNAPLGISLLGPKGSEAMLLRVAKHFELGRRCCINQA